MCVWVCVCVCVCVCIYIHVYIHTNIEIILIYATIWVQFGVISFLKKLILLFSRGALNESDVKVNFI